MSIAKLGGRIAHVHLRDADGLIYYGAPVSKGIIDWYEGVRTLNRTGYDGFLSLDYTCFDDFLGVACQSKRYFGAGVRSGRFGVDRPPATELSGISIRERDFTERVSS